MVHPARYPIWGDGIKAIECIDESRETVSDGRDGEDGTFCSVFDQGDGPKTIECSDGRIVPISDGIDGVDGTSCRVFDEENGIKKIICTDGSTVTVPDGANGTSCRVFDEGDGIKKIIFTDGSKVTISDGQDASVPVLAQDDGVEQCFVDLRDQGNINLAVGGQAQLPGQGKCTIVMPNHFPQSTTPMNGANVQLTPVDAPLSLYYEFNGQVLFVSEARGLSVTFNYLIQVLQ